METAPASDLELISKTLQVEHKLFYFDLKENPRGRYLKISEKTSGSRSTIIVPASGISYFVDLFKYYAPGDDSEISSKDSRLESSELQLDTKAFHFDVGENQRGRFLKISEASINRSRSTIIVPAGDEDGDGWAAFRNILSEIDDAQHLLPRVKDSADLQEDNVESPIADRSMDMPSSSSDTIGTHFSQVLRAEQKKFFFDLGSNARGQYLRISEVTGADRSAIILPASALEQFYETLGQFVETVRSPGTAAPGFVRVRTAPLRKQSEI